LALTKLTNKTAIRVPLGIINDLSQSYEFLTLDDAITSTIAFPVGKVITLKERTTGDGGGETWDVVLSTSVTENTFNIVQCTGVPTLSLVLRVQTETTQARTWYVDPVLGVDEYGKGITTGANAFKTIQYAYDSLPTTIIHNQVIQLADGVYNTNYLPAVDIVRPAILFAKGKLITARTEKSGTTLTGGVVIKGNSVTPSNVVIESTDDYHYGIYNTQGQLGLQDFLIKTAVGATNVSSLLTSHRMDSYIHAVNVSLDGTSKAVTDNALLAESGGQIEFTTTLTQTDVKNCSFLVRTLTSGDNITISGQLTLSNANTGILAIKNSHINWVSSSLTGQVISNCSDYCISALSGATVEVRGDVSTHILIDGAVNAEIKASIQLIYADTTGLATINDSSIFYNNSNYQGQINAVDSSVRLTNANSYISPATASSATIALALLGNSAKYEEGTNNIVGSGGLYASRNPLSISYNTDSQVKSISNGVDVYRMNGNGANRLLCELSSTNITEGRVISLYGDTWAVQLTSGTHMDIPVNFSLGSPSGSYAGCTLTMVGGLWRVTGLGQVRP